MGATSTLPMAASHMTIRKSTSSIVARFGTATLVAGTLAGISPGCLTNPGFATILLSRNTPGGTLGFLSAPSSARGLAATTFTINSDNAADVSTVNWIAIPRQNIPTYFVPAGSFRRPPSGTFVVRGAATLAAGTKTVVTGAQFSADARIFVTCATIGGTPGKLSAPAASINPATGTFVINSNQAADTSIVDWVLVDEPLKSSPSGTFLYQANGSLVDGTSTYTLADRIFTGEQSVIASVCSPGGTVGNLNAPLINRSVIGTFIVASDSATETSLVEVVAF